MSHESKTHSPPPPPPSLPAQQACSSDPVTSASFSLPHPPPTDPSRPRTPAANRTWSRSYHIVGGALLARHVPCKMQVQSLTCTPGFFWECCRTWHLETSLSVAFSRSWSRPLRFIYHRALIHYMYRSYANALSISRRNPFTYIGAPRWRVVLSLSVPIQISRVRNQSRVRMRAARSATRHCGAGPVGGDWDTGGWSPPMELNHICREPGWTF